ncbi:MAG: PAS domain-containing sensor histidine kinase [Chloroflexi bacterium]|nr:PAS domain-containing sensor histidine kinase [Chloroflexota bacterium]
MHSVNSSRDRSLLVVSLTVLTLLTLAVIVFAAVRLLEQADYLGSLPEPSNMAALQFNNAAVVALVAAALLFAASAALTVIAMRRLRAAQAERVQAEVERQLAENTARLTGEVKRLKAVLDGMNDGIIYTENSVIRYANRTVVRMIGYDGSESETDTSNRLAGLYQSLSSLIGQNSKSQGVFTIRRKDGTEFDARVTHTHLDSGGVVTVIEDNSAEKTLQNQRLRFVSNASHELRTPVANLKTRVYLMRRQPEKLNEHLDVVEQVIGKMQQLMEDLFDFTEIERGNLLLEREDVALQDLITEVVKSYQAKADRRSVTLECDFAPRPLLAFIDRRRFAQVMTSLISSALSHTREGGTVQVRAVHDPDTTSRAIIQVQDNGVGIARDLLAQVFQPFSLAKHGDMGGTALGLTLSKEIVEMHGGTIVADSEEGKGTLFTIRLPLTG